MKKLNNDIFFYSVVLVCYVVICLLIMNAYFMHRDKQTLSKSGTYFPTVILDAGHGGEDSGAVSADGILEKDINLNISLKLRDLLTVSGFKVLMTREEDVSIHDDSANSIRAKKVSDLNNRLKLINKDKNSVLISIHQNKFENSKYSGAQTFYSETSKSRELAQSMRASFCGLLQSDNKREIKPAPKNVFILNKCKIPGVIVECGFLSNEEEVKKLCNESYQNKVAFTIYCGFIDYWRKF